VCVRVLEPGTLHRVTCQSSYCVRGVPGYFTLIQDYFSWYPTTIPLDFSNHWRYLLRPLLFLSLSRFFFYSFAFRRPFTSAARSILSEKLSARPYIRLGRSTRQRGNQHSGRVHSSLLSYIPLKLPNAQSFTVTLPTPRYTCVSHVQ
jgi:hypothetical protein